MTTFLKTFVNMAYAWVMKDRCKRFHRGYVVSHNAMPYWCKMISISVV